MDGVETRIDHRRGNLQQCDARRTRVIIPALALPFAALLTTFTEQVGNDVTAFTVLAARDDDASLVVFHGHGGDSYLASRECDGMREIAMALLDCRSE